MVKLKGLEPPTSRFPGRSTAELKPRPTEHGTRCRIAVRASRVSTSPGTWRPAGSGDKSQKWGGIGEGGGHNRRYIARLQANGSVARSALRTLLLSLDKMAKATDATRRGLRVLKSFVGSVNVKYGDIDIGLSLPAENGAADGGDLEADLTPPYPAGFMYP